MEIKTFVRNLKYLFKVDVEKKLKDVEEKLSIISMQYSSSIRDLQNSITLISKVTDISMDIGLDEYHHRNWAVICVHGKMDYVKFIEVNSRDIWDIAHFLRQFEDSNRIIDAPLGMKEFLFHY